LLTRSFIHIPGIGEKTERNIWAHGITDWICALDECPEVPGISLDRWSEVQRHIEDSLRSLEAGDHTHFARGLPNSEHWRSFSHFERRVAYLDIETTGLGKRSTVTVVGIYDGSRTHSYIAGENLDQFAEDIEDYSLLVTFNGGQFDIPFLKRTFPQVNWSHLHCDLRWVLKSLGHTGGLKKIERKLGLSRSDEVDGLSGYDAVILWQRYLRGDEEALRVLVEYNAADVQNLQFLMQMAYDEMSQRLLEGVNGDQSR
jgi:hypothetical protein